MASVMARVANPEVVDMVQVPFADMADREPGVEFGNEDVA